VHVVDVAARQERVERVSIEGARGFRLKVACANIPTMSSSAGDFSPLSARAT
jgi:hypothetical protein